MLQSDSTQSRMMIFRWRILIRITLAALFLGILSGCDSKVSDLLPPTPAIAQPIMEATSVPTPMAAPFEFRVRPSDGMQMVFIPGGSFQMGSSEAEIVDAMDLCREHYQICNRWYYERESPAHTVMLIDFWLDRTEVSNAQYRLCVEAGVCPAPVICDKGEPTYADPVKADHPVACVSWEAAQDYCHWAGARLPTEAEWEYAFRGANGSIFPWGNVFDGSWLNYCDQNCSQAHADERFDDGFSQTAPVGSFLHDASWSGVLDMSGNVAEWVADWYGDYSPQAVSNPLGPSSGSERVLKGCSWFFHPAYCRAATRGSVSPSIRRDYFGFRCAAPLDAGEEEEIGMMTPTIEDPMENLPTIDVPVANSPSIDGRLQAGEWDNATVATFADGSELFLMYAQGYLYLGLRASTPGMIVGNIFVQRGNEIAILHSSAALGTAVYQQGEGIWHQVRNFEWRCRSIDDSPSAQAERATFLQKEGWLAANSFMGTPNELEYQIAVKEGSLRLAVNFIRADVPNVKVPWPKDLADDCILPTPGGLPVDLRFSPDEWATIVIPS
jgi:formylglycine-generating enzyme required for sulfatase activity